MKPELLRKVMAKFDAIFLQTAGFLTVGKTDLSEKRKTILQKGFWKKSPQRMRFENMIRKIPDQDFEKLMSSLESLPPDIHKSFKDSLAYIPKNRGGRPPHFPLETRRRAIQDLATESSRGHNFTEALEIVAKRHGMGAVYLHKVWKNRKRLNRA